MGAIKIGSTTRISSTGAATFTSISGSTISASTIDVSGNSDANAFRINGTGVINSARMLYNISSISATSIDVSGNSDANYFKINGTTVVNSSRAATFTTLDTTMINAKGLQTGFTTITVSRSGSTDQWNNAAVTCPTDSTLLFWSMTKLYAQDHGNGYPDNRARCTVSGDTLTINVYEDNDANVEATCLGLCAYT